MVDRPGIMIGRYIYTYNYTTPEDMNTPPTHLWAWLILPWVHDVSMLFTTGGSFVCLGVYVKYTYRHSIVYQLL